MLHRNKTVQGICLASKNWRYGLDFGRLHYRFRIYAGNLMFCILRENRRPALSARRPHLYVQAGPVFISTIIARRARR